MSRKLLYPDLSSKKSIGNILDRRFRLSYPDPFRGGMVMANIDGVFATIYLILVSGAYLTGYALFIGLNDFHLGLLAAIPSFSYLPGIFAAHISHKIGSRKNIIVTLATTSRILWFPMILISLLNLETNTKVWSFITLYFISSVLSGTTSNLWLDWFSDLVHEKIRGRFLGKRNAILNIASIVTMLFAGFILDHFKFAGFELAGYIIIILLAIAFSSISGIALKLQYEPPMQNIERANFLQHLLQPLKNKQYRRFLSGFSILNFSLGLSAAFFTAHMIKNLNMSFSEISYINIFSLILGIFFNRWWGTIMDKSGLKSVLLFNLILVGIIPFFWLFTYNSKIFVWLIWVLVGVGWSGFSIAAFNLPFILSPKEGRSYYLGVFNIIAGFFLFAGSTLGGFYALKLQNINTNLWFLKISNYNIIFFIGGIGRLSSYIFFRKIRIHKDKGIKNMLLYMRDNIKMKYTEFKEIIFS